MLNLEAKSAFCLPLNLPSLLDSFSSHLFTLGRISTDDDCASPRGRVRIIIIIIIINLLSAISQWFNGALQFKLKNKK